MAIYTEPTTRASGFLVTANVWNTDIVENLKYFKDAPVFGGVVTLTAGTVSAPALTTSGDTNTGLYFPAADTISMTTGGTERVRVTSAGNVGIGVTPSVWDTGYNVVEGLGGSLYSGINSAVRLGQNLYFATSLKYKTSSVAASLLDLNSGDLVFSTAPAGTANTTATFTEQLRVANTGLVTLAGGQIKFPATQNASADANTLDDYEEGTWTPAMTPTSGSGITYTSRAGLYTKVGRLVIASYEVHLSALGTASGAASITGLPFAASSVGLQTGLPCVHYWSSMGTNWSAIMGHLELASIVLYGVAGTQATTLTRLQMSDMTVATRFIGTAIYMASA